MNINEIKERQDILLELGSVNSCLLLLPNITSFSRLTSILERRELNGIADLDELKEFIEQRLKDRRDRLEHVYSNLENEIAARVVPADVNVNYRQDER